MTTDADEWAALQSFQHQCITIKVKPEQEAINIHFKNHTVREFSAVEWACIIAAALFSLKTLSLAFGAAPSTGLEMTLAVAVWFALGGFVWPIACERLARQWFRDASPSILSVSPRDIVFVRPRYGDWRRRAHRFPIEQFTATRTQQWPATPHDGSSCLHAALYLHFGPYDVHVAGHSDVAVINQLEHVFNLARRIAPTLVIPETAAEPAPVPVDRGL